MHSTQTTTLPPGPRNEWLRRLFWFFGICWLASCRPASLPPEAYASWLANPANGLRQTKQVAIFDYSVEYFPPAWRAWREINSKQPVNAATFDSLKTFHEKSLYFIFTIAPNEKKSSGDVLYSGLKDYSNYDARIRALSFQMAEYWTLNTPNGAEIHPVLTNLENTYSLTDYRKLHLVFVPPDGRGSLYDVSHWDVTFRDEVFGTGIHHFVFFKKDWENIPELNYLK